MTRNLEQSRVIIIGGGLVGLGTAYALMQREPRLQLTLLDKEMGDRFDAFPAPQQADKRFISEIAQRK